MKKYLSAATFAICGLLMQYSVVAQDKEEKEKTKDKMGEYDEIIIKRKTTGKDGKITIEIKDGEVRVDGKPLEDYENENLSVRRKKTLSYGLNTSPFRSGNMNFNNGQNLIFDENRPFLGVTTDATEGGAKITAITKSSAAEKAGLMKGDIITKVNDEKVDSHSDVTKAIGKLKPEDKVSISYKRDGKENKATAILGKRSATIYGPNPDFDFDFDFDHEGSGDHIFRYGGKPRIGIKAQDTEDSKGVKVLDVDEGSAADKAGIKEDDVITEFDGKAVNSADALSEASREAKEKSSFKIKFNRGGSSQTVEVKIPKKLKTANL